MHSTYTAFKQGVLTENTGRKMWPAREKHMGRVLGQLFNIGGMGLIILMALDSIMNFKILCNF